MDRARAKKELFDGGGSGRDAFDTNENKGNKGTGRRPVVIRFAPFLVDSVECGRPKLVYNCALSRRRRKYCQVPKLL